MTSFNYNKRLSKTISHALRHAPWEYELELDDEGWVSIPALLSALQTERHEFADLSESDLNHMMLESSKERFEIKAHKIRALYGHSIPNKLMKEPLMPPTILFHGTSPVVTKIILKEGLKPMNRHYVHLSIDIVTARQVALRKSNTPVILTVDANQAH